jgi:hypothetical protein
MKSVADLRLALAVSSVLIPASFAGAQSYIMGANSTLRGVHLFDATTGALVDRNFIVDPRMSIPQEPMRVGNEIWVIDAGNGSNAIYRFNQRGLGLGKIDVLADYGTNLIRGGAVVPRESGAEFWIAQDAGTNATGKFLRYSLAGAPLGAVNMSAGNLSPFDILARSNDLLVSDSQSDDIDRYDLNGNWLGKFVDSDSAFGFPLNFPQQIAQFPNGNIGVISFSLPAEGIRLYTSEGVEVGFYSDALATGSRGIAPLDNGGLIHSRGDGFYTRLPYESGNTTATTVLNGPGLQSGRWLNRVTFDVAALPTAVEWTNAAGGTWATSSNWTSPDVPDAVPESARFGSAITAARTVTLDSPVSLVSATFDNANSYTIAGAGSINFGGDAPQAFIVTQGVHAVQVPVTASRSIRVDIASGAKLTLTNGLNTGSNDIVKLGDGQLEVNRIVQAGVLAVGRGRVTLTGPGGPGTTTRVQGIWIDTSQRFDIGLNDVVVDGGATPQNLVSLRTYISVGRLLSVLTSQNIRPGYGRAAAIGITSWDGVAVSPDATIIRRTLPGDTNLDRVVNFDDLLRFAANYNQSDKFWYEGDFNYNGIVNFDDLLLLASNYNQTLTSSFAGDWALAQSIVPEPTALVVLGGLAGVSLCRRRR